MNTKTKGDIAVAHAVAAYTDMGYEVLLPMGDKKPYDLVVDNDLYLLKVQVKYAGLNADGKYRAQLRTVGGNQSFQTVKKYVDSSFDLLFIWTESNKGYSIPWVECSVRNALTISPKYEKYAIGV